MSKTHRHILPRQHGVSFYTQLIFLGFLGGISFLEILPALAQPAGISAAVVSAVWALVPVVFTLMLVWIIDYWEPEPLWLYGFAFLWGGGVSVVIGAFINDFASSRLIPQLINEGATVYDISRYTASWVSPLSEEVVKGFGIILIYVAFRHYFNGPIDGIVYGALIGAGFGFTENILYFVRNYDFLAQVFTVRFLDGPLSHDTYSALFGFFIGFAEFSHKRWALVRWLVPALLSAGFFHFINNDALNWEGMTYTKYKILTNVPLAVVALIIVIFARFYEKQTVVDGLEPYVRGGLVARHEAKMIEQVKYRRQAIVWAEYQSRKFGAPEGVGAQAMRQFQQVVIQLGHETNRLSRSQSTISDSEQAYLQSLLSKIESLRRIFTTR
ncbi:PrsW family intramembrane metalloprotease [Arcanobacterium phocisimile]|uniref:PrsW family intramembrane metalloprotease n=1 Tax=Arcanobacterium phocisimile TaxID=1302235 RepID=A0ABX7IKF0_9ACTO|nr:PrsW family intramembrane metalloprotease [Arcanobacterium phocisimile]QRV02909.1 PrsW family intramembrane metalloprotease [Arcanobacterium phocisimile]